MAACKCACSLNLSLNSTGFSLFLLLQPHLSKSCKYARRIHLSEQQKQQTDRRMQTEAASSLFSDLIRQSGAFRGFPLSLFHACMPVLTVWLASQLANAIYTIRHLASQTFVK